MRLAERTVAYLGHNVVPDGTAPQEAKVEAITAMPAPINESELKSFLGTASYYRRYIQHFSRIADPLNMLLQKGVLYTWDNAQQKAFDALKKKLTEAPILRRPDHKRPFELHTDWSKEGLGAVLAQRDAEGNEYVVAYASRSFNKAERNYSSYQGECLAAVLGRPILPSIPLRQAVQADYRPSAAQVAHDQPEAYGQGGPLGETSFRSTTLKSSTGMVRRTRTRTVYPATRYPTTKIGPPSGSTMTHRHEHRWPPPWHCLLPE